MVETSDFPQANGLLKVGRVALAVNEGNSSDIAIAKYLGMTTARQGRYFRLAASLFGLVVNHKNHSELTKLGSAFAALQSDEDRAEFLSDLFLEAPFYQNAFKYLQEHNPDDKELKKWFITSYPASEETAKRRASSFKSYLRDSGFAEEKQKRLFVTPKYMEVVNSKKDSFKKEVFIEDLPDEIQEAVKDIENIQKSNLQETEKERLVQARLGQGKYRKDLVDFWKGRCALTNVHMPNFLVASHIQPWKSCDNEQRLSKYNGLLLQPNIDKAFDKGWITFEDDGSLIISPDFTIANEIGLAPGMSLSKVEPGHKVFLAHHRQHVFEKWKKA